MHGVNSVKFIDEVVPVCAIKLLSFLTMALDGSEWSASYPSRFTPRIEPLESLEFKFG